MGETIEGKLKSVSKEAKRTVLVFEVKGRDQRVSAFDPGIPDLKIGSWYVFSIEKVTKGEITYTNLERTGGKNSPYKIEVSASPQDEYPAEEYVTADKIQKEKPSQEYWDKRERKIVRQHSQEMAIRYAELQGIKFDHFESFVDLCDLMDTDVFTAAERQLKKGGK